MWLHFCVITMLICTRFQAQLTEEERKRPRIPGGPSRRKGLIKRLKTTNKKKRNKNWPLCDVRSEYISERTNRFTYRARDNP